MCTWGTLSEITIERRVSVDSCIANAIVELNRQGVYTTGCCCGHGKGPPTATILPSSADRAKELGYDVQWSCSPTGHNDPYIALDPVIRLS